MRVGLLGSAANAEPPLDLLLVNTPIHDYASFPRFSTSYSTPVGLLYLATSASQRGFTVEILDAEHEQLSPVQIVQEVYAKRPRYVGFNAFSVNFRLVNRIAADLHGIAKTVVGGPHVSVMPIDHLAREFNALDFVVRKDGEAKLIEILEGRAADTPGVLLRDRHGLSAVIGVENIVNLDALPIPNRTLLDNEPYIRNGEKWVDISISRGCIFTCGFCAGSCKFNGTTYVRRSEASVAKEVCQLRDEHAVQGIEIVDDLPFSSVAELERFISLNKIAKLTLNWELNLPLAFLKRLRPDHFQQLGKIGVVRIAFGVEAGDERIRKSMGKAISEPDLFELSRELAKMGITHKLYFIIGFPKETAAQIDRTVELATRLFDQGRRQSHQLVQPRLFMFKPFPGSRLWNQLRAEGYSEEALLSYEDFKTDVEYFMKHSWGTTTQFSEVNVSRLQEIINRFYNETKLKREVHA